MKVFDLGNIEWFCCCFVLVLGRPNSRLRKTWILLQKRWLVESLFSNWNVSWLPVHFWFTSGFAQLTPILFRMLIIQGCLLFLFWYPIMTALATGHSSLTAYVRRCAILTGVTAVSDCTTLGFMIIFIDKAPIPLLATVYVSFITSQPLRNNIFSLWIYWWMYRVVYFHIEAVQKWSSHGKKNVALPMGQIEINRIASKNLL